MKEAEEAAARSDERARVAEAGGFPEVVSSFRHTSARASAWQEAHGRLLREKADMADATWLDPPHACRYSSQDGTEPKLLGGLQVAT